MAFDSHPAEAWVGPRINPPVDLPRLGRHLEEVAISDELHFFCGLLVVDRACDPQHLRTLFTVRDVASGTTFEVAVDDCDLRETHVPTLFYLRQIARAGERHRCMLVGSF